MSGKCKIIFKHGKENRKKTFSKCAMQLMCISGLKLYRLFLRLTQWESVFSFYKYDIKLPTSIVKIMMIIITMMTTVKIIITVIWYVMIFIQIHTVTKLQKISTGKQAEAEINKWNMNINKFCRRKQSIYRYDDQWFIIIYFSLWSSSKKISIFNLSKTQAMQKFYISGVTEVSLTCCTKTTQLASADE